MNAKQLIDGYAKLKIGMSKQEVLDLFEMPTGQRTTNGVETYTWKHSEFKGVLRGGTIVRMVAVDFENDKVTGFDSENMDRSRW